MARETPMRQSCDRCHSQKLRCIRTSTNTNAGACSRCFAKRVQCVYSFCLPKGRPSVYHLAEKSTGSGSGTGNIAEGAAENTTSSNRRLSTAAFAPATNAATADGSQTESAESHADVNANADATLHSKYHIMSDDSILSQKVSDTPPDVLTEPWPCFDGLTWDDLDPEVPGNWSDIVSSQPTFHWPITMDPSLTSGSYSDKTACLAAFPALLGGPCSNNDAGAEYNKTVPASVSARLHKKGCAQGIEAINFEERSNYNRSKGNEHGGNINTKDPDVLIAQLSQLSIRLSQLRQSFSTYLSNDHNQGHQKPLIDDATIESVAAWLIHGSSNRNVLFPTQYQDAPPPPETKISDNVLYHLFSASQHLLEILRHIQGNTGGTNTPNLSNSINSTPSPVDSIESTQFTLNTGSGSLSYSFPQNHPLNNVIRHLSIACHTMLLNIYVSVLQTLEQDAHRIDHARTTVLGDICLVSVVQLCSYLTVRQHQAIGMYLSAQSSPVVSPWQEHLASNQGLQLYPDAATGEEMRRLNVEVQQRLAHLQQMLYI